MRKRRAIVFDDDTAILTMLTDFFSHRGYEVFAFHDPSIICPLQARIAFDCGKLAPCADIMLTDFHMPRMTGLDLLHQQTIRGCGMDIRNKAIISGFIKQEDKDRALRMGYTMFPKPFPLTMLMAWLDHCEQRMDLGQPLACRRRETRMADSHGKMYTLHHRDDILTGAVVNRSESGLCMRLHKPLAQEQRLIVRADASDEQSAVVRWVKRTTDGAYLAGLHFCK